MFQLTFTTKFHGKIDTNELLLNINYNKSTTHTFREFVHIILDGIQ